MVKLTMIGRLSDGLVLAVSSLNDSAEYNQFSSQAKLLLKKLTSNSSPKCTFEADNYNFHVLINDGVCYLTLTEKLYDRNAAFNYLEELQREFHAQHGNEVQTVAKPYAFVKFEKFIEKTKKQYEDGRKAQSHAFEQLHHELNSVHAIMTENVKEVLSRGEKLENVSQLSTRLSAGTHVYKQKTATLNQIDYKGYAIVGATIFTLGFVYFYFFAGM